MCGVNAIPLPQLRHEVLRRLREFFDQRRFIEVCTPLLSQETVIDPHIEPFRVRAFHDARKPWLGPTYYLQTSPELHMKRLLASGMTAIYQVTQAFRATELGPQHNPEFTIAEWYRVGDDFEAGMQLLVELVQHLTGCATVDRIAYRAVFLRELGCDPLTAHLAELRQLAQSWGAGELYDRDDCLNWLFGSVIQPRLGHDRPILVYEFPVSQAALSRVSPRDPRVAERFELFIAGIELANGYHELTDPDGLRRRLEQANAHRQRLGLEQLPLPQRLLHAQQQGLPACSGTALGFDRLLLVLARQSALEQVLSFPWDRA